MQPAPCKIGQDKLQTADRVQNADWVQDADRQEKLLILFYFRLNETHHFFVAVIYHTLLSRSVNQNTRTCYNEIFEIKN